MLVGQTAMVGRQVCLSNSCGRKAGMFVCQTAVVGRQVCLSVKQLW